MMSVGHGLNEKIPWDFMAVGHTKFRSDESFGSVRNRVDRRTNVYSIHEMRDATEASSYSNQSIISNVSVIQDWKNVSEFFRPLPVIQEQFTYKIHIKSVIQGAPQKVRVEIYRSQINPLPMSPFIS